jgi:hypothetical protein
MKALISRLLASDSHPTLGKTDALQIVANAVVQNATRIKSN